MSERLFAVKGRVSLTDTLQRAIRKQRSGDTVGARERYRRVLRASPGNDEVLVLLGQLERRAGNYQAAAAYLRAAARLQPERADVYDALGKALSDGGESKAAMRAFLRVLEIDPAYAPTYVGMGRAFERAGRRSEAKRCFAEAARIDPALGEAHFCLARLMHRDGKAEAASREYSRGLELDPDALEPRLKLARICLDEGRYETALVHYEECLLRSPGNVEALVGRAGALIEDQRLDEAVESCQKALQFDARSAAAMVQLGRVHLNRADLRGARQSFSTAERLAPGLTAAETGLAAVLEKEGRFGEALLLMRRVVHKDDAGFESDLLLARLLRRLGEGGEALQRLRIRTGSLPVSAAHARRALELETARLLEDEGQFSRALLHYATAAGLNRRVFDPRACRREVESIMAYFDTSAFARLSRAQPIAATPVIIVGMPSTGVQMLRSALSTHTSVILSGSHASLASVANGLASTVASGSGYPASSRDARSADLTELVSRKWPRSATAQRGRCLLVDASWQCDLHLGLAELLFPTAKVIHCTRDAHDAALACYFRDYRGPECAFAANLSDIIMRLHEHNRLMRHWRRTGGLRILTVSREAFGQDPPAEMERVLAFVDLGFESACLADAVPRSQAGAPGFYTPTLDPSIGRHLNFKAILGARLNAALAAARYADPGTQRDE